MGVQGASGDLGYQWKTYRMTDRSGAVVATGRLLTLFERRDGRWLILADTWNPDAAPVAQAPR
jgi:ketosteroid isomerase-like protein